MFEGSATTAAMKRSFQELTRWLGRALSFPVGTVLLTGTAIVPDLPFTLTPGDTVRISVDGLGTLLNPVVAVGDGGPSDPPARPYS